jgi:hypothetical protein
MLEVYLDTEWARALAYSAKEIVYVATSIEESAAQIEDPNVADVVSSNS